MKGEDVGYDWVYTDGLCSGRMLRNDQSKFVSGNRIAQNATKMKARWVDKLYYISGKSLQKNELGIKYLLGQVVFFVLCKTNSFIVPHCIEYNVLDIANFLILISLKEQLRIDLLWEFI